MKNLRTLAHSIRKKLPHEESPLQEEIEHQINHALKIIRNDQQTQNFKFSSRVKSTPWVLLLGQHNSGKTSLIKQAGQILTSTNHKTLGLVRSTKGIDWWFGENIVLIDPAAQFSMKTPSESKQPTYWKTFLRTLTKKVPHPFDSLCLVVDVPSLTNPSDPAFDLLVNHLQQQILLCAELQSPLCINLVISQCDHLYGFAEFFNSLSPEEQQQACGFSIIEKEHQGHFSQSFELQFERFMHLTNTKLLERLHHEPNLERRLRLSSFPTQLEQLLPALNKLIDSLPDSSRIVLNNLFFCSAEQTTSPIDFISSDLDQNFNLTPKTPVPLVANQKALFIPGMMEEIAKPFIPHSANKPTSTRKVGFFSTYPIALGILLLTAFGLHRSYQSNVSFLENSAKQINAIHTEGPLSVLDQAFSLKKELKKTPHSVLGFNTAYRLKTQIGSSYQALLKNKFGSYLQKTLTELIHRQTKTNSVALYNTLRTYLMFTSPDKMQADFVKHWLDNYWQTTEKYSPKYQAQLQKYLTDYLHLKNPSWPENSTLVQNAQKTLQQQPLAQLAFRVLENNYSLNDSAISSGLTIEGVKLDQATIKDFYDLHSFSNIYNKQIPKLAKSYFKGNWVVGKNNPTSNDLESLTQNLRQLYVNNYLMAWQESLSKIKIVPPSSYQDSINQINLLTNAQSPLWQLYQNAIAAAKKAGAANEVDQFLNSNPLSAFLPGQPNAQALTQTLKTLRIYLLQIEQSPSNQKAAFDAAVKRFKKKDPNDPIGNALSLAHSLPEPLQQWQTQLVKGSWHLILLDSKQYIASLWKTNVFPFYESKITDHYPIFSSAKKDMSTTDFNNFFGPGGVIQDFFNTLEPFINLSHAYWSWKELNGEKLAVSQTTLDMLIRASMIQKMFYTDNPDLPTVRFKLTPVDMSDKASQFVLNIGGQMIRYLPGLQKTEEASWPGEDGSFVTLQFTTAVNNNPTFTTTGEWAWLRLLNASTLQATSDPKHYQVTFKLDGNEAIYDLVADNSINPYLPNILNGFRLPENL